MTKLTNRLSHLERAGKSGNYPKWQALGLLMEYGEGPEAARLYLAGRYGELKALFLALAANLDGTHPPYWDLSGLDTQQLDWAVQHVGQNLSVIEKWSDSHEPENSCCEAGESY